jgi:hypothetical protein
MNIAYVYRYYCFSCCSISRRSTFRWQGTKNWFFKRKLPTDKGADYDITELNILSQHTKYMREAIAAGCRSSKQQLRPKRDRNKVLTVTYGLSTRLLFILTPFILRFM